MQEIQFPEFMGGSNLPQAFPNNLICLRFIRISKVLSLEHMTMKESKLTIPWYSFTEQHRVCCLQETFQRDTAEIAPC